MNRALKFLCGAQEHFDLENFFRNLDLPSKGLYKCRMVYDEVSKDVEFIPYQFRPVHSLRVIEHDRVSYEFKYADRKLINRLYELRKDCDDVLIVKRGYVTDSSYANIIFKRGKNWYTPWSALLKGTMRANLIERNLVQEEDIRIEDIKTFDSFKLVNAMWEFDAPELDISKIVV
jgi:4-amino-4-deoxychorismate lyase